MAATASTYDDTEVLAQFVELNRFVACVECHVFLQLDALLFACAGRIMPM